MKAVPKVLIVFTFLFFQSEIEMDLTETNTRWYYMKVGRKIIMIKTSEIGINNKKI